MSQYLVLIYGNENKSADGGSGFRDELGKGHAEFAAKHGAALAGGNALQTTDVYFLPSFRESTPVTLLEACLAGCYPVVADTSAQGEIVRMCGGIAVPVESMEGLVNGLTDAILWCSSHREELATLAGKTAEVVSDRFASDRYDSIIQNAYNTALGRC